MSMINFIMAVNTDIVYSLLFYKIVTLSLNTMIYVVWNKNVVRIWKYLLKYPQIMSFSLSNLVQMLHYWPYKRVFLTLRGAFTLTKCQFRSGPAKNWPYKRVDLTSVDLTSGLHCTSGSVKESSVLSIQSRLMIRFSQSVIQSVVKRFFFFPFILSMTNDHPRARERASAREILTCESI